MFHLTQPQDRPLHVLCFGAHSDDIEIGCGATLLHLIEECSELSCDWIVFSANSVRREEANRSADAFLQGARVRNVMIDDFRDGFFPAQFAQLKERFESFKELTRPDLILTHSRDDRHQDHRIVSDLTWNTYRSHLILEYEIPKFDGDLGQPNTFVPLRREHVDRKIELLTEHFSSQMQKQWFTRETIAGLMRIRGIETPGDAEFAEAFYARKIPLRFGDGA